MKSIKTLPTFCDKQFKEHSFRQDFLHTDAAIEEMKEWENQILTLGKLTINI